jgi:hypothetical protein
VYASDHATFGHRAVGLGDVDAMAYFSLKPGFTEPFMKIPPPIRMNLRCA